MRISSNTLHDQGLSAILRNQAQMLHTQQQVSTGKRILTPADDPVAAAQALDVSQADAMNTQYATNRSAAADSLSLVEGSLAQVSSIITNVRTIAVNVGSGILSDSDRVSLAAQLSSALSELQGAANATDGQGRYLFAGYQSQSQPFSSGPVGVQYNGDDGQRLIQVDSSRQMGVSVSGADVFTRIPGGNGSFVSGDSPGNNGSGLINPGSVIDPSSLTRHNYSINFSVSGGTTTYAVVDSTTNATLLSAQPYSSGDSIRFDGMDIVIEGAPVNGDKFTIAPSGDQSIFKTVQDLIDLLQTPVHAPGDSARLANGLKQGLINLDQALGSVLTQRGVIGAKLNEIDVLQSAGSNRSVQYQKTLSRLQNVDLNVAISDLTQEQLSLQAAQKSFVQISGLSLFTYL
ncbi:Flagellar hook-associated protein flgL [Georgfuchsia toluolica]|uniref:Flagellar hook-associated protein flgL n=1 Tax=Georgfuchsia toluolica TaxID=424218 RepID=A0A916J064_9PROT|nr:flagellar hook-associated protein FlgL [Georgfuchsia toluolica]CAG4882183.1 Flagellar hook-associated protein flgL [Georgfuchsia toluolica]